jgi:hypothetical protein
VVKKNRERKKIGRVVVRITSARRSAPKKFRGRIQNRSRKKRDSGLEGSQTPQENLRRRFQSSR